MLDSFSVPDEFEINVEGNNEEGQENLGGANPVTPESSPVRNRGEAEVSTPLQSSHVAVSADRYDDSVEPRWFKSIQEVYAGTEETELDDELLFAGIDERQNFQQTVKEKDWRTAMDKEIESIEKNGTWKLTMLPDGHKVIDLKWIRKMQMER